jgi:hypothetical protein
MILYVLKIAFPAGAAFAAFLSGIFWIIAARAKVISSSKDVGVGYGGAGLHIKDDTGTIVEFLQTYALQSKWNARAAWTSGAAGLLGGFAILLQYVP